MKLRVLFISILLTLGVKGQNLKTFNGKFDGGKGSYQYYEKDNGERIKHGSFFLISSSGGGNKDYYWTVEYIYSGNYSNGLKDGDWIERKIKYNPTINTSRYDYNPNTGKYILTKFEMMNVKGVDELTEIKSTYSNGKLNGSYSSITYGVTNEVKKVKTEVKCEFKDNCFVGDYKFNNPDVSIKGGFDNGFMTGIWNYKKFDETYTLNYFNGFIIKSIKRGKDGTLIEKYSNYKPFSLNQLPSENIKYDTNEVYLYSVDDLGVNQGLDEGENTDEPIVLCGNEMDNFKVNIDLNLLKVSDVSYGYYKQLSVTYKTNKDNQLNTWSFSDSTIKVTLSIKSFNEKQVEGDLMYNGKNVPISIDGITSIDNSVGYVIDLTEPDELYFKIYPDIVVLSVKNKDYFLFKEIEK